MLGARPGLVAGLLVNLGLHIPPTQLSLVVLNRSPSAQRHPGAGNRRALFFAEPMAVVVQHWMGGVAVLPISC